MATISLRLSNQERNLIQAKAEQSGLSMSEYVRKAALKSEIQSVLPKQKIAKALCTFHNRIDDAKPSDSVRQITHELEDTIYGCL